MPVPEDISPWVAEARRLVASGEYNGALEAYEQALAAAEPTAGLLVEVGNLLQSLNSPRQALELYQDAVMADPQSVAAHQSLGYMLSRWGEPDLALEHFEHASRLHPSPMSRLLAATVLPVIYDSRVDLDRWRNRLTNRVAALVQEGCRVETGKSQIPTPFFFAYQGLNDREIMSHLGRIYVGQDRVGGHVRRAVATGSPSRRLRVGFLSAYFRDHTIGRLNLGMVQELNRRLFEVVVLSVGPFDDVLGREFQRSADQFVPLPPEVASARDLIAAAELDVLIFTDVGMDAVTSTLVYSRLAPIQCATWGHPDTTGSPCVDYFLSGELLEIAAADEHYTEQLVRLPSLGVFYHRPQRPADPRRSAFGLREEDHVYACPQTLYKFHPDFDAVLAEIVRADPAAVVVSIEGQVANWTDRLRARWSREFPELLEHVRFLPPLAHEDFLALFACADVALDPFHFGGGNTSYEALAMGTPVVTFPSPYLRGRITAAMLQRMELPELIASSPSEYVATAVRIATDDRLRANLRSRIDAASPRLFQDRTAVEGLERFLLEL